MIGLQREGVFFSGVVCDVDGGKKWRKSSFLARSDSTVERCS